MKFKDVFSNVIFSEKINNVYDDTIVTDISIISNTKTININLLSDKTIDESMIELFCNSIKETFTYIDYVNAHIKYNKKNIEINEHTHNEFRLQIEKDKNKAIQEIKEKQSEVVATTEKKIDKVYRPNGNGQRKINLKILNEINDIPTKLNTEIKDGDITVKGEVFYCDVRSKDEMRIVTFSIYDGYGSIEIKFFTNENEISNFKQFFSVGANIIVKGKASYDNFSKEMVVMAKEICHGTGTNRYDDAEEKRVELHLHTTMSQMDSVTSMSDYIKVAKSWGHKAIAVTDHGVVQAYPEASRADGIKMIYGMEAYVVNDQSAIVSSVKKQTLDDEFVIFDIETTGLSKDLNKIIEIGAVKLKNGEIIDRFSSLIDPKEKLSEKIIEITKITDEMLEGMPTEDEIIPKFLNFCSDSVMVAHNANFDVGFIRTSAQKILNKKITNTVIDTVELSRLVLPDIKNHKLNTLAEHFKVELENHHRAVDDAVATCNIFLAISKMLKDMGINTLEEINLYASKFIDSKKIRDHTHMTILVQNQKGLKNLYELVSLSHINYFYRNNRRPKTSRPRIPLSELSRLREGLLIGSACLKGFVYNSILENKPDEEIEEICNFYDFLEVQPSINYNHMFKDDTDKINKVNEKIINLGKNLNKIVVATGDVHFLNPGDEIYRKIILFGEGMGDFSPPLYFKTTDEMLEEFDFLGKDVAKEIVITNTNKIADMIDEVIPIPKGTFPPKIEGSEEELRRITMENAHGTYGDILPKIVEERIDRELNSIINNGFAVMYMSAHTLIKRSLENKYTVGSRGSVGSSLVATLSDVTEVNPLPAHYLCKNCRYSEFDTDDVINFIKTNPGASGSDLPDKKCPKCNDLMHKEGHDIPFETFLGFEGDKEPDIDLNFSGEYQQKAHDHAAEIFGIDKVYKAGTISTLADKTAYGYTMKYLEQKEMNISKIEINRIKIGATGVKRTTGQHPGGLMIVPKDLSIYDFTPIQRPANDIKTNVTTTHFDYRSISGRLLKLDLLGHDVPTIIRMLWDITGIDPRTVPLSNEKVLSLFSGPEALGITNKVVETGSLGIPEFGTSFVRSMLLDTKPNSFGELVRISGLSHGTDVWLGNAQSLIKSGICTLKDVIATRDDIMVYLISKGIEKKLSFTITENVRKGKGLIEEWENIMREHGVPDWYIDSCKKIKYMFPKGHAVAYVMMAVRIAYYKIYHPYSFYASIFSVKTDEFDYEIMCISHNRVKEEMETIRKSKDVTASQKGMFSTLELVNEMYERGLKFLKVDIYKAQETKFLVEENGIMPPLATIKGLGETVAKNILETRINGEFTSLDDFKERTKANKTTTDLLVNLEILKDMPQGRQLTLF
ncbi:MAG: PolC-type DNA polymerase III [Defluviitaleaceae bacterium]|nr:PolC-type DNA polymerase III [Defluviitaleaceae bacterium]